MKWMARKTPEKKQNRASLRPIILKLDRKKYKMKGSINRVVNKSRYVATIGAGAVESFTSIADVETDSTPIVMPTYGFNQGCCFMCMPPNNMNLLVVYHYRLRRDMNILMNRSGLVGLSIQASMDS